MTDHTLFEFVRPSFDANRNLKTGGCAILNEGLKKSENAWRTNTIKFKSCVAYNCLRQHLGVHLVTYKKPGDSTRCAFQAPLVICCALHLPDVVWPAAAKRQPGSPAREARGAATAATSGNPSPNQVQTAVLTHALRAAHGCKHLLARRALVRAMPNC